MQTALDVVSGILLVGGAAFAIVGGIGIHRFPDCFARMHAGGITDTLVATSMLLGLALQIEPGLVTVKLFAAWFFLTVTSPTSTHALAQAALHLGIRPKVVEQERESSPS